MAKNSIREGRIRIHLYFSQKVCKLKFNNYMTALSVNRKWPVFISLATVLPFILMEIINRKFFPESFPYFLFGMLWLLMLIIIFIFQSLVKNLFSPVPNFTILNLMIRFASLILLGYCWISLIIDQIPCFLGGTNCD